MARDGFLLGGRNWRNSLGGNFFLCGAKNGLGFAKLFSGDFDFRKTETNLFLNFVRAEERSGEECGRVSDWGFLISKIRDHKIMLHDCSL